MHTRAQPTPERAAAPPVVAGLADPAFTARDRGLVLLGELGCVSCHHDDPGRTLIDARRGPDLAALGSRVLPDYLPRFLADPHGVEPGTTMPDVLRDRSDAARAVAVEALAHYLRSFGARAVAVEAPDAAAAVRGREWFHAIGCVACHAPRDADGKEQTLPDSAPLGDLTTKYHPKGLRDFLRAPRTVRPSARMPDLNLLPGEARDLSEYLLARRKPAPEAVLPSPLPVEQAKVAVGRALFAERGCAHCHQLPDPARAPAPTHAPLRQLAPTRGCLSDAPGAWPFYALTGDQRADLVAALRAYDEPVTDEQRIHQMLAARNCTACHQRGDSGGPARDRNHFFRGEQTLGEEGRLPPSLTGVGAKLQRPWLVDAIAHGQSIRPYLHTRMPGFDAAFAAELADLLARVDRLPPLEPIALPEDDKQAEAVKELGRELTSDKGMNCITCHLFASEQAGAMAAVDLVDSTAQRLRPEWFQHFLRAPARFRPGTLMPQFFADGNSARPELGGGDVARQIDALWHYLAEGRNVRKPSGMRRPPIHLTVGDEAVILRRKVQNTGKRGISVGYPSGVNLTFDAESLGLNQIWWGGFVDAGGVFSGQGSGEARILSKDLATLPKGPAFVVLPAPDAPWPDGSRRDLGHEFLGYDLDAKQRPAFRYVCDGVTITDAPVDVPADVTAESGAKAILRRTLTFASAIDTTLSFRAAHDARIDDRGAGVVQVGRALHLRLPPGSFRIRDVGEARELLVAIALQQGRAELAIEYSWREVPK